MSRELKTWVSDRLHSLLGFSEGYLADYVCGLAGSEPSVSSLLSKLEQADVPVNDASRRFAAELFQRAPRKASTSSAASAAKAQRREAVELLRKQEKYAMVDDDGAEDEEAEVAAAVQAALHAKEKERKRAERRGKRGRDEPAADAPAADAEAAEAEAREADLRERDEFAERLRQKDLEKTKKLHPDTLAMEERKEEAARLLAAKGADERAALLERMREVSRPAGRSVSWSL